MDTQELIRSVVAAVKLALAKDDGWLTEAEAAQYLRVSPTTIRQNRAKLGARLWGKRWRFRKIDIDRALLSPWMK